jgi:hypothetical protein
MWKGICEANAEQRIGGMNFMDAISPTVTVDKDPSLGYEQNNAIGIIFNYLAALVLNLLPPSLTNFLIDMTAPTIKEVRDGATTHQALDALYMNQKFSSRHGILKGAMEYAWFRLGNARAVRNRLKLVKKFLRTIILERMTHDSDQKIRIFSLGCGSSRAIIETLYELRKGDQINMDRFDISLLDKAPEALELSRQIIREHNLKEIGFSFIADEVGNFPVHLDGDKIEIIEMVGVLDYLKNRSAIRMFRKINNSLKKEGFFITANIRKNSETSFLNKTIRWFMIYREPEELMHLLLSAGFERSKIQITFEPLRTHSVALCRK